jgi:hypothetical protein
MNITVLYCIVLYLHSVMYSICYQEVQVLLCFISVTMAWLIFSQKVEFPYKNTFFIFWMLYIKCDRFSYQVTD